MDRGIQRRISYLNIHPLSLLVDNNVVVTNDVQLSKLFPKMYTNTFCANYTFAMLHHIIQLAVGYHTPKSYLWNIFNIDMYNI